MTSVLLAFDFDGTVARIRADPDDVEIDPEVASVLAAVSKLGHVALAFLSGRDLDDLQARTSELNAFRSGSHGLELSAPDGRLLRYASPLRFQLPPGIIASTSRRGIRIEQKNHATALHWRGVRGIRADDVVMRAFRAWAVSEGLSIIHGRSVVEARLHGPSKLDVLREVAGIVNAAHVVFAGDDLTDFPALEWAAAHGTGLFLVSEERPERPRGAEIVSDRASLSRRIRELVAEA